jgi:hypothetical protein
VLIGGIDMNVTVYRHEEYRKFIVSVEIGFSVTQYTLYDVSISELGQFIREVTKEV